MTIILNLPKQLLKLRFAKCLGIILITNFYLNISVCAQISVITKTIEPISWSGIPVVKSEHIKGGLHTVSTTIERDAINVKRRHKGMFCFVINTKSIYQITGNVSDNSNWRKLKIIHSTGSRPATPDNGDIIYNTTTNTFEYWNGSSWGAIAGSSSANLEDVLTEGNSAGNRKITNLSNPTNNQDASTKSYVDFQHKTVTSGTTSDLSTGINFRIERSSGFTLNASNLNETRTYTWFIKNTHSTNQFTVGFNSKFKKLKGSYTATIPAGKVMIVVGIVDSSVNRIYYTINKQE